MAALIHIDKLTRTYGDRCVLDGISFDLQPGEVLGFLGTNGAGKSTTMQIICGTLAPSSGEVTINGANLQNDPVTAKSHIGYLPETPPLYSEMRVDEYLAFCARLRKITPNKIPQAITQVKQRCGLESVGKRLIANLSKGYKQRVGIAQAIIHNPRVIILDEPTSGLDPNQIQEIRNLIKSLASQCGILISTHILSEVQSICTRVLILHQGDIVYRGAITPDDQHTLLVTLDGGSNCDYLSELAGVCLVEQVNKQQFRIQLSDTTIAADIAHAIITHGDRLHELRADHSSLEQTFSRLTLEDRNQ
ncbi:MAG: ABC transporter ATP-binding protein [Sedimenticola sp.]|nr:ABC transporter ATP-binding protein [Sedimenticola sp.]